MAADLAGFIAELRNEELPAIDDETPYGGRPPLAEQDEATRDWIAQAGDLIDGPAVIAVWEDALNGTAPTAGSTAISRHRIFWFARVVSGRCSTSARPASVTPRQTSIRRGASSARTLVTSSVTWSVPTTTPGAAAAASRSVRQSGWFRTMPSQTQR